jgi:hypothetical protein
MTFALFLSSIADAISHISISGVTVKDVNELSAQWISLPDVLYPNPDQFITNYTNEFVSVLRGDTAPVNVHYTLNYRFLHVQVGDMAAMPKSYSDLLDKVAAIINAIQAVHAPYSGRVDMVIGGISLGPRDDPAGNQYFGADIALNITEMQN